MKIIKSLVTLAIGFVLPIAAHASTVCPTTTYTNSDCGYIITIGTGGSLSGAAVTGANAYDGSDDALIGVVNNSGSTYTGSFTLMGSGNGGGLFAFEDDGICTYVAASYCNTAATGYEGPINTFSNISTTSVLDDTGTVNITGLANGGATYFSLESSPSSVGNIVIAPATPEPSSLLLLGSGVLGLAGTLRRRLLDAIR